MQQTNYNVQKNVPRQRNYVNIVSPYVFTRVYALSFFLRQIRFVGDDIFERNFPRSPDAMLYVTPICWRSQQLT